MIIFEPASDLALPSRYGTYPHVALSPKLTQAQLPFTFCPRARDPDPTDGAPCSTSSNNHHRQHRQAQEPHQRLRHDHHHRQQTAGPLQQLHRRLLHAFEGLGLGSDYIVEGCIGMALVSGCLFFGGRALWETALHLRSQPRRYEAVLEFPLASGIALGTPVRIRGVSSGSVVRVRPSLERIDATIQVMDSSVYIPRNSLVEVYQSGLASETIIDIIPGDPVPHPTCGPLHPNCPSEGLIVCDKERIKGIQGASLDELILLSVKMARHTKGRELDELKKATSELQRTLDCSRPLMDKIEKSMEEIEPVVKGLQDGRMVKDMHLLLRSSNKALTELRSSKFVVENGVDLISILLGMLKELESTTADVSNLLRDGKTRSDLKQLIELLSRLVNT